MFKIISQLFDRFSRQIAKKLSQISNNYFMSQPCLYKHSQTSQPCEHPECQIIRTIRKNNQPVFEGRKISKSGTNYRTRLPQNQEELIFQEDQVKQQSQIYPQNFLKASSKTIQCDKEHMLINRISQLENDVSYLKEMTQMMKSTLYDRGGHVI